MVRAALEGQPTDSSDRQVSTFTQELVAAVPAIGHGTLVGIVAVCSALDDLELKQRTIWAVVVVTGALALATSGFLAEPLARWILRPAPDGLAIAASLARVDNGHVLLQAAPGGGLHAEVRLPARRHLPSMALPSLRG